MTEARAVRARLVPLRASDEDEEMRDVETDVLAAECPAGKAGATSAREEDKSSSEGSSSVAGDQSDADATRMSDEQSDGQGASRNRFKAAQALSIRTAELPDGPGEEQTTAGGEMTSAAAATTSASPSTAVTPVAASGKPEGKTEKATSGTAAPPPAAGKKRRRRTAAQIDRKYSCNYPGCTKAYGSEGSLTQHQRLKHRQTPEESLASSRKSQLGKLFLPLHRSPSGHLKAGAFLPPSSANATRTVSIRPATMGGMPGSPFNVASPGPADVSVRLLAPDLLGDSGAATSTLRSNLLATTHETAQAQHRSNNLRSRSNSMPISFTIPSPVQTQRAPASTSRATARKSRASSTPRPKSTTARRAKSRSKSESLSGLANFAALDGMQPPRSDRSISDSTASTHEPVLPLETAEAQPLRSSWSVADVTMSMDDQAIDSDILSVLANCDPGELGDGPASLVAQADTAPESASAFHSQQPFAPMEDQEMLPVGLECFKIAEDMPAVDSAGSLKRESYRDGHSLQHDVGNVDAVGAGVGAGGSLFSVPDALPADAKEVAKEAADVALASSPVTAFDPPTDNFDMPTFDAPAENNSHSLSQINSFSGSVSRGISGVEGLNSIQAFRMDTTSGVEHHDPGTPLQGIPTKLEKLNIENNACWRDVASLLNEPDSEEQLPQDPQQPQQLVQSQDQLMWTKDGVLGSAFSANDVNHAQNPALSTSSVDMDWQTTSKLATTSSSIYFQTSALHTETAIPGLFSDFLMSEAGDFGMLDSRMQTQVLGQDDDFL